MEIMSIIKDKLREMFCDQTIASYFFNPDDFGDNINDQESVKYVIEMYGFDYNLIHQHGGENQGLVYYTVYEFIHDGYKQLVKFYGQYHSYIGTEYLDYSFVEAREKKVVCYE